MQAIAIAPLLAPLLVTGTLALAAKPAAASAGDDTATFPHQAWGRVLERFVDDRGFVDYQALAKDRADLDRYLNAIRAHSPDSDPQLFSNRDDALAYWINAYNAQVFEGVLERGPEQESVWSGLISGRNFFVKHKIVLGGKTMNLKKLEDDIVRERFEDPRVHAALNCASKGCPRLPKEPFVGDRLQQQLDEAMRLFVSEQRNVEVDASAHRVRLSKIFDWFSGDFLAYERRQGNSDPKVLDFVNRYRQKGQQIPRDFDVSYIPYDKSINAQ